MYKKEYVQTFLEKQGQLFDEPEQMILKRQRHFWKTVWQLFWIL